MTKQYDKQVMNMTVTWSWFTIFPSSFFCEVYYLTPQKANSGMEITMPGICQGML